MRSLMTDEADTASHDRAVPVVPPAGTALKRALNFEWLRLKGLRSTWAVLGALTVLALLNGVLLPMEAVEPEGGGQPFVDVARLVETLQFNAIAMQLPLSAWLLVFVFGTGPIASEFRHQTARTAWLTVGGRGLSYTAKLLVGALGALTGSTVGLGLGIGAGSTALAVRGLPQPDWPAASGPLLRYLIVMTFLPVLAGGLAASVRSRLVTVLSIALWPLLLERIFGLAVASVTGADEVRSWLPFAAARAAMNGAEQPDGFTEALIGSDLAPLTGLSTFCFYATVLACCGWLGYRRRAVS
ncbi:hypothetical protein ACVW19_003566 [Streptomyces sp. TE5632]